MTPNQNPNQPSTIDRLNEQVEGVRSDLTAAEKVRDQAASKRARVFHLALREVDHGKNLIALSDSQAAISGAADLFDSAAARIRALGD